MNGWFFPGPMGPYGPIRAHLGSIWTRMGPYGVHLVTSSPYVVGSNRKVHQKLTFWRKNVQNLTFGVHIDTSSPYVFGSNRKVHQTLTFWRKHMQNLTFWGPYGYKFSLRFRVQSKRSPKIDFLAETCAKLVEMAEKWVQSGRRHDNDDTTTRRRRRRFQVIQVHVQRAQGQNKPCGSPSLRLLISPIWYVILLEFP